MERLLSLVFRTVNAAIRLNSKALAAERRVFSFGQRKLMTGGFGLQYDRARPQRREPDLQLLVLELEEVDFILQGSVHFGIGLARFPVSLDLSPPDGNRRLDDATLRDERGHLLLQLGILLLHLAQLLLGEL